MIQDPVLKAFLSFFFASNVPTFFFWLDNEPKSMYLVRVPCMLGRLSDPVLDNKILAEILGWFLEKLSFSWMLKKKQQMNKWKEERKERRKEKRKDFASLPGVQERWMAVRHPFCNVGAKTSSYRRWSRNLDDVCPWWSLSSSCASVPDCLLPGFLLSEKQNSCSQDLWGVAERDPDW